MHPHTIYAQSGENIRAFCSTRHEYNVLWTFNDGPIPLNARHYQYQDQSVLHIRGVTHANVGVYECTGQLDRPHDEVAYFAATMTVSILDSKKF